MTIRIVFMGSPDFAVPTLQALADHSPVVGVVTQPDKPAGRGQVLTPPPVKQLALQLKIPVIQPQRLKEPAALAQLEAWQPDMIVVAAFGQILRPAVLEMPRFGCINVHASLLPRWRGAAPIQAAILAGDAQTGITIMRMDAGVDTGDILAQRAEPILPTDTAETLTTRLAALGGSFLVETLPHILSGDLIPQPQNAGEATYAAMLKKSDGELDFSQPAVDLERRVRAMSPWPGAYTTWQGQILKVHRAHVEHASAVPGALLRVGSLPAIAAADGALVLDEVQPAGKKPMPGEVFLRGARDWDAQRS
ncbi:MAG: methionyl-tRNA formyltransferase [Anaerolineaceae bacterium]